MSDLSTLKEEILEWANKPGTMKKFTTHDVYDAIHSAEDISKTSDTLRGMWRHDKTLEREEFMDGNRKRFFYWLSNKNVIYSAKITPKESTFGSDDYKESYFLDTTKDINIPITVREETKETSPVGIEIPNNFCIELKTPNGFTITIKAGDLMK